MSRDYSPNRGLTKKQHIEMGHCVCGYSRKLDAIVSNGCKLHPDRPSEAEATRILQPPAPVEHTLGECRDMQCGCREPASGTGAADKTAHTYQQVTAAPRKARGQTYAEFRDIMAVKAELERVKAQRDRLLAALKRLAFAVADDSVSSHELSEARVAIAAAVEKEGK